MRRFDAFGEGVEAFGDSNGCAIYRRALLTTHSSVNTIGQPSDQGVRRPAFLCISTIKFPVPTGQYAFGRKGERKSELQ